MVRPNSLLYLVIGFLTSFLLFIPDPLRTGWAIFATIISVLMLVVGAIQYLVTKNSWKLVMAIGMIAGVLAGFSLGLVIP